MPSRKIADWQITHGFKGLHVSSSAVFLHATVLVFALHDAVQFHDFVVIYGQWSLVSFDGNPLKLFGPHHRSHTAPSEGINAVKNNIGITDLSLSARTNDCGPVSPPTYVLLKQFRGLPDFMSPDLTGISQFRDIIMNPQVNGIFRGSFNDDCVITGSSQL